MTELKIRCSAIGRLMTEPKTKAEGPLSVGAKTAIREIAAQDIFGVTFEISDRKLEKGNLVEPESLALLNRVRGLSLVKNTERRANEWITGECDLFDAPARAGHDLKSAWSVATFPICMEDIAAAQRALYEWQFRGYMWLWDAQEWHGQYCLVDTPEHLIGFEPLTLHVVSHIPEFLRLTSWTVRRDAACEMQIALKVKAARSYYAQVIEDFNRTHPEAVAAAQAAAQAAEPPPWSVPAQIISGTSPTELVADPF